MAVVSGCAGEVSEDPPEPTVDVLDEAGSNQDQAATEVTTSPQGKKTLGDPAIATDAQIQGKKMFGDGF